MKTNVGVDFGDFETRNKKGGPLFRCVEKKAAGRGTRNEKHTNTQRETSDDVDGATRWVQTGVGGGREGGSRRRRM